MKKIVIGAACMAALATGFSGASRAQDAQETICAQGPYSLPCPKVIWCPAEKCGIGIPRSDGTIEIIYSSEEKMDGTHRRPVQAGSPMTLQDLAGKVIVFEWEDSGKVESPGSDLTIKSILYVIMPPPNAG